MAKLSNGFAGEIVRPDDPGYDAARAVWNSMIDRRPALIVRPTGTDDVVAALRFAREQELVIAIRCGGHSIPGFSTCDDGIVIDLSRMHGADVDPERRTAQVRGGSLLAELDDAAQAHRLVCPVGVVSHTGVAGLTLGGGMGRLQCKLGLTIDSLLAVELVTADGQLVGPLDRVGDHAVGHLPLQRVQQELERRHDPEVRTGSSHAPEELRILVLACPHDSA